MSTPHLLLVIGAAPPSQRSPTRLVGPGGEFEQKNNNKSMWVSSVCWGLPCSPPHPVTFVHESGFDTNANNSIRYHATVQEDSSDV